MDNIKTKLKEVLSIKDLDITEKTTIKDVLNVYNSREDTTIKEAVKNMLFGGDADALIKDVVLSFLTEMYGDEPPEEVKNMSALEILQMVNYNGHPPIGESDLAIELTNFLYSLVDSSGSSQLPYTDFRNIGSGFILPIVADDDDWEKWDLVTDSTINNKCMSIGTDSITKNTESILVLSLKKGNLNSSLTRYPVCRIHNDNIDILVLLLSVNNDDDGLPRHTGYIISGTNHNDVTIEKIIFQIALRTKFSDESKEIGGANTYVNGSTGLFHADVFVIDQETGEKTKYESCMFGTTVYKLDDFFSYFKTNGVTGFSITGVERVSGADIRLNYQLRMTGSSKYTIPGGQYFCYPSHLVGVDATFLGNIDIEAPDIGQGF